MSWSVRAVPVTIHSGSYPCSWAFWDRKMGNTGSHPQTTVVMPALFSLAMMLVAWFDIEPRSSLYLMRSAGGWPPCREIAAPASAHSW